MNLGRGKDETGKRFNFLTAISPQDRLKNGTWRWNCRCDCGTDTIVPSTALRNGAIKSCGCKRSELIGANSTRHGLTKSRTYISWKSMWARCTNPKAPDYKDYGGRGITIDPRWELFETFLADMGERPLGKSLDRKRNHEGYSKDNCKWSTPKEQANNRRNNRPKEIAA